MGSTSKDESQSLNVQNRSSGSRSFVDPNQAPFLQNLFNQGQQLSNQQLDPSSQFQTNVVNPSQQAFQNFLTPQQNPFLQNQIEQGQFLINENLNQNILPATGGAAVGAGQFGGGRQGVAEGIAMRDANRTSANFAENLIGQDFQNQQQRGIQALSQANNVGGLSFSPLQNLAQILGQATVLNSAESRGSGRATAESKGTTFGLDK